jgi:murein DD-endopeptidase MepM/ murein hydrolase activator NlpD
VTPPDSGTQNSWARLLGGATELTSKYGMRKDPIGGGLEFHEGIDLAASQGTKVYPFQAGTVEFTGWQPGLGRAVIVDHGGGFETVYGHTSESLVKRGQSVTSETVIAKVGSTGRSTGPHLHFEARRNGKAVDPLSLFSEPSLYIAKAL